ncbi:hypothetical protein TYRP_017690 [Tyrophagus putrescentiae]|nr:hypothetical protein TYRP_017690 [Tyrophagus putrescentiae]
MVVSTGTMFGCTASYSTSESGMNSAEMSGLEVGLLAIIGIGGGTAAEAALWEGTFGGVSPLGVKIKIAVQQLVLKLTLLTFPASPFPCFCPFKSGELLCCWSSSSYLSIDSVVVVVVVVYSTVTLFGVAVGGTAADGGDCNRWPLTLTFDLYRFLSASI